MADPSPTGCGSSINMPEPDTADNLFPVSPVLQVHVYGVYSGQVVLSLLSLYMTI